MDCEIFITDRQELFWQHIAAVIPLLVLTEIVALQIDDEYARRKYNVYSATAKARTMAQLASQGLSAVPA